MAASRSASAAADRSPSSIPSRVSWAARRRCSSGWKTPTPTHTRKTRACTSAILQARRAAPSASTPSWSEYRFTGSMPDLDEIRAALARIPNPIAVLESLFALAPVGLQIYEAGGRSLLVNQAFIDLFGAEPPPGYNVLQDEIAAKNGVLELIQRAFRGETISTP